MSLRGQHVLVLGGSGAMGSAIARRAAADGAAVILAGRDREALEQASASVPRSSVLVGDAVDPEGARALYAAAGKVDHLVVAISAGTKASSIPETNPTEARAAYAKVWATYAALHHAPSIVSPSGSMLLLSGSSGRRPGAGFGVWTGVHGAIEALARAATIELAPIRVNVISPGGIGLSPDRQLAEHEGMPADIAEAAVALLSNPAVTGAVLGVDGGERLGTWSGSKT